MTTRREFVQKASLSTVVIPFLEPLSFFAGSIPDNLWQPVHLNHFPNRLCAFVFRIWDLQPMDKIAAFLKINSGNITDLAEKMGLQPQPQFSPDVIMRNTLSTIYRLWDILPKEQILEIIGMTYQEFYDFMHTDIALWYALGTQPEGLTPLTYTAPTSEEIEKIKVFKNNIYSIIPENKIALEEEPFAFIKYLNETHTTSLSDRITTPAENEMRIDSHWTIHYPANSGVLMENSVKDFLKFCEVVMQEPLTAHKENDLYSPSPQSIILKIVPGEFKDPESHFVEIIPERIEIRASDERGIMRGLYFLEDEMMLRKGTLLPKGSFRRETWFTPRYIFSYYDMYGNMLKESVGEFYTENYLRHISHVGVNGIWLQCILSELVPTKFFPEFGKESKMEIDRLNGLIDRAKKCGMNVYIYFNEPRGRTDDFYERHPECRGGYVKGRQGYAMCTSSKVVQEYLVTVFRDLFNLAPGLAGIILITASENLTSCYSNSKITDCPRCSTRQPYEVVAEVINLINKGVKMAKPDAEVIAWDWSWHNIIEKDFQDETIKRIDPSVILMADYERGVKIKRGGIETEVNEYCLSVVGPSQRAIIRARQAREKGTKIHANLLLSNTMEMCAVPYVPVLPQIAKKFENMRMYGFDGAMESWGGVGSGTYPSMNFEVAKEFYWDPFMKPQKAVENVAVRRYNKKIAKEIIQVWEKLTESFSSYYPMDNGFIYSSPILYGSARNLHFIPLPKPYGNTTILNPKDDNKWGTAVFHAEVQIKLLELMAEDWQRGADELRTIFERAGRINQIEIQKDLGVVNAIVIHFKSTANQIHFNLLRNELYASSDKIRQKELLDQLENITKEEIELAKRHYLIARIDSRIGYDNYRPANILEKIANCHYILQYHIPEFRTKNNL